MGRKGREWLTGQVGRRGVGADWAREGQVRGEGWEGLTGQGKGR